MSTRDHLYSVVATLQPVIYGVSAQKLDAPTPCPDFDVRTLANHLLGTVEAMRRMGAGEPLDRDDPWGTGGDHLQEQWTDDLSQALAGFAHAWSQPAAWEGEAMDGAMPRHLVGDMGYLEVLLHGWDLARGSGQEVDYDESALVRALEILEEVGDQGRSGGAFGPQVGVAEDASVLAKVLGASGRDFGWTP